MAREHLSIRIDGETRRELEREAARRGTPKTTLAESLLREAVRMTSHPGITFREGPAGRRAGVIGGPDVWEVVEVWKDNDRDAAATSAAISLPIGLVDAAVGYYVDQAAEIDAWIERNRAQADEAEAAWRRRQTLTRP
ncbi:MAG TPA: CopG family transcriptional regulator [Candidatus Dormibacteraeota bacterium]|nr:CopG family transcriptional regulator [Candidatus Dormibacteraeota bacterium]